MMLAMCWLQAWQQPGQGSFDMPPDLHMDWTLPSAQEHHPNSAPLLPEAPAQHTSAREPQVGSLCRNCTSSQTLPSGGAEVRHPLFKSCQLSACFGAAGLAISPVLAWPN